MAEYMIKTLETEQRVHDAAVAHIHSWCLHQTLADVVRSCRQPADQQQINEQIQVPATVSPLTSRLAAKRCAWSCCSCLCASVVQNRRSVAEGTRRLNCGTSRSRCVRMKISRHVRLSASLDADRLSGNPPRSESASTLAQNAPIASIPVA